MQGLRELRGRLGTAGLRAAREIVFFLVRSVSEIMLIIMRLQPDLVKGSSDLKPYETLVFSLR